MNDDRAPWFAISRLTESFKAPREVPQANGAPASRLTPEAVQNQRFTTTRLLPGYAMEEVDAFLDQVKHEMARLIQERDAARARE
jgi:DivIVA domain-containing protein